MERSSEYEKIISCMNEKNIDNKKKLLKDIQFEQEALAMILNDDNSKECLISMMNFFKSHDKLTFIVILDKICCESHLNFKEIICSLYKKNILDFNFFFDLADSLCLNNSLLHATVIGMDSENIIENIKPLNKTQQSLFFNDLTLNDKNISFIFKKDSHKKSIFILLIMLNMVQNISTEKHLIRMFEYELTDSLLKEKEFEMLLRKPSLLEKILESDLIKLTKERYDLLSEHLKKGLIKERAKLEKIQRNFEVKLIKKELILDLNEVKNKKRL